MLKLQLKNLNTINSEGNRIYLEDITGEYSLENEGGYGNPNANREDQAILILGLAKTSKGDKQIELEQYNPLASNKFTAIVRADGWYQFKMLAMPLYDEELLNSYAVGDTYYDAIYGRVLRISEKIIKGVIPIPSTPIPTQELPSLDDTSIPLPEDEIPIGTDEGVVNSTNTLPEDDVVQIVPFVPTVVSNIVVVEDEIIRFTEEVKLIEYSNSEFVMDVIDTLFIANNSLTKLKVNTMINELLFNGATFADKRLIRMKDNYNALRAILQGSIYEYCRGNKYVAQKNIEFLNTNDYASE